MNESVQEYTREHDRLQAIAEKSFYQDVYRQTLDYCFLILRRHLLPGSILELGPAEGAMTDLLYKLGQPLTVVEGASIFCEKIKDRCPDATVVNSLFETFNPSTRFSNIILGHVLEHVEDPVALLRRVRDWLTDDGMVFAAVPNSMSLHRQAGVLMGKLPAEDSLNAMDIHHGHRRVYNPATLLQDFNEAGFSIKVSGGYFMKIMSQAQLEKSATPEMIKAFCILGERYPETAGEIYAVLNS